MWFKVVSNKGKIRDSNEDNYYIKSSINFLMVADGMGGHAAGEVASQIAVETCKKFDFDLTNPLATLKKLTQAINQKIINESNQVAAYQGMGTTFVAALLVNDCLYYVNLGDSRIYVFENQKGELTKLSRDHSLVENLLREGKITEKEAFNHPRKNIVTQALGLEKKLDIDSGSYKLAADDYLLLCTDGLTDMIPRGKIENYFNEYSDPELLSKNLLAGALTAGGADNITFIVAGQNEN